MDFLSQAGRDPALALVSALVLAVLLVNGWTDAPNAIAAAVGAGALSFRGGAALAAVCNLAGSCWGALCLPAVARTVGEAAALTGAPGSAWAGLCAALAATAAWGVLAWRFGIPTSESHALLAALAGAALARPGGWRNLTAGPWERVGLGLVLSLGLGCGLGWLFGRNLGRRNLARSLCRRGQILGAAGMAFLHGAQDGQKCLGLFLAGAALAGGSRSGADAAVPAWLAAVCGGTMALGTLLGGRRIVARIGEGLVPLSPAAGLAADLGGGAALLGCTLLGLPVSTTHAKTSAILGAGAALGGRVDRACAGEIVLTWLCTFPACGALGYLLVRAFA